jgi:hypothetical protein
MSMSNSLEKETAVFKRELPRLLAEEGKFALIIGDSVIGTFESYSDALQAGYAKAGLGPFLVKRISSIDEAAHFTRPLILCQA